jgi:polysaccharide deacetylase family protein (PEP-CTERM system associated)
MLDELGVKATFFAVAEHTEKNADIIREIVRRGHEIACHGLDHKLLYEKGDETFREEIAEAKRILERVARRPVIGYRASCFSMDRGKLELLRKAGFLYDSSKITFAQHPLYRYLDLIGFEKVDDLIYRDGEFFEFEIPTLKIQKYSVPISGGGYLRLFPFSLLKALINKYELRHENFLIYVHPFELTAMNLPMPGGLKAASRLRCLIGRKRNLKKLRKLILHLKSKGGEFRTLGGERGIWLSSVKGGIPV